MRRPRRLAVLAVLACLAGGCAADREPAPRRPATASPVALTADDRAVWQTPAGGGDRIPVLLYHGLGDAAGFTDQADAFYAVTPENFAKQMALLAHAGYTAVTLRQFRRFALGKPVDLPEHPLLLTFDDGRADSLRAADPILREHGWSAVMFVDVGAVADAAPGYAGWGELADAQRSGRWSIQLHAGRGHHSIRYGERPREVGPYYAYRDALHGETLAGWSRRVAGDLDWGEAQLRRYVPGFAPLAFAPPYGAYGQLDTNDPAIPRLLGRELHDRYGLVFVQDDPRPARAGERDVRRLQLDRTMTGGDLHYWLSGA